MPFSRSRSIESMTRSATSWFARNAPELRRAIRAIPGRSWDPDEKHWRIRLGPDRAEAVARLIASFPDALAADENARHRLDLLRRRRDPRSPGVESVVAEGVVCLNICDDVDHPVLDEL